MNHLAQVLGSGRNKINASQSVVSIEFNRKTTGMKGYPQVNRMQIRLRKREKKFNHEVQDHWEEGNISLFLACPGPWASVTLSAQPGTPFTHTPQTWWPGRSAHDGSLHSHVTQLHQPPPNTAAEWHLLQLSLLKGRAAPGYPRFQRTQLSCIVFLCQVTITQCASLS